jgi:iron-sulfur cluster repair protein YtfE (RIC family)
MSRTTNPPAVDTPDLLGIRLIHRLMRTDLHRLTAVAQRLAAGEPCSDRRAAALARWVDGQADEIHEHHTAEDAVVWPVIVTHAGAHLDLAELSGDHDALDPLLAAACTAAADLVAAPTDDRTAAAAKLAAALAVVRDEIDEHLDAEEAAIFPVIERWIPAAEWERVEAQVSKKGPGLRFTLPRIVDVTTPAEFARLRSEAGPALVLLLKLLMPGYRRREKLVFG